MRIVGLGIARPARECSVARVHDCIVRASFHVHASSPCIPHSCGTCRCREGRGGGYKELDEQELEEARRRRREAEEVRWLL